MAYLYHPLIVVGGVSAPRIFLRKDVGSPCINHSISGASSVTLLVAAQTLKSSTYSSAVCEPCLSVAIFDMASPILSVTLNAVSKAALNVAHEVVLSTALLVVQYICFQGPAV